MLAALKIRSVSVKPVKWQKEFGLPTRLQCGYVTETFERDLAKLKTPEAKEMRKTLGRRLNKATTVKKNRHKAVAQGLFPCHRKLTHSIADALLIAEYGRRVTR